MKKITPLLLSLSLLFQSCFSTRWVSNADILRNEFKNSTSDDVEYKYGSPDEVEELRNGYAYMYYYGYQDRKSNYVYGSRNQKGETFTRFAFDNNDYVRNIQSTRTVPKKQFNAGATVGAIMFFGILLPVAILVIAESTSE